MLKHAGMRRFTYVGYIRVGFGDPVRAIHRRSQAMCGGRAVTPVLHTRVKWSPMAEWIPILSVGVALVATIVGPTVSWIIARQQLRSSLEVSNKQVVAPMRQAWINSLRDLLAELVSNALHYHQTGFED
jgi:hypothetical protein